MSIVHTTTVKPKVFCSHFVVSQISQQFEKYQLSLYLHILCLTGTWWNSQVWNEKFPQHSGGWVKHSDLARTHCSCKFFFYWMPMFFFAWIACIKIPPSLNLTISHAPHFLFQDNPPYDKGAFRIEITFPAEYPFKPPKISFKTKIYHPNIDEKGQVCLPVISAENWKPATKTDQGTARAFLSASHP